jgi:lipopolysaccharide/colanic/teichoic acid biosynthesis glycosyltransferase
MHPVNPIRDPSVPLEELSATNLRVYRDFTSPGGAQPASPQFDSRAMACDDSLSACENDPKILSGTANVMAASTEIPLWKRILDCTCIVISLPFWLPVMIFAMLWIKVASPGPIFFRQERVGYRGRRFMIFKFRTMKVNVETQSHERHLEQLIHANCPMTKLDASGDPRIIPGGRLIRAMGLDELPQLFNVLSGEMSLVGPRPCTPYEFKRYVGWQQERVNAPPGLTGYWQVNGKNKTTFTEMISMDIFYAKNMSLRLDLAIILRTLPAVMAQLAEARIRNRARHGDAKPVGDKPVAEQC